MWRDVVDLGNGTESIAHGESIYTFSWRTVFANKKSVRQSEFYQAANAGLKPEMIFEVRSIDFDNDERLKYDGAVYVILRVYNRGDITELTVAAYVGSEV